VAIYELPSNTTLEALGKNKWLSSTVQLSGIYEGSQSSFGSLLKVQLVTLLNDFLISRGSRGKYTFFKPVQLLNAELIPP
jgi:hypothetical protein